MQLVSVKLCFAEVFVFTRAPKAPTALKLSESRAPKAPMPLKLFESRVPKAPSTPRDTLLAVVLLVHTELKRITALCHVLET